jgi:hypothetical protein
MASKVKAESLTVDTDKIRDNIITGGLARKVANHEMILKGSSGRYKWFERKDKTYLRYTMNFDSAHYRSNFGTAQVELTAPGIQDGLAYQHYELEAVQGDILPLDARQRLLAQYFAQAEDRIFFAGVDPGTTGSTNMAVTNSATKTVIDAAAGGTYASTTVTTEIDFGGLGTALTTVGAAIGQIIDGLDDVKPYPLLLIVSPDVYKHLLGAYDTTDQRSYLTALNELLLQAGAPGGGVYYTKYLGATLDYNTGEIEVTAGTLSALLMAYSPMFTSVKTSPLIQRSDVNDIDGLRINIEEKYVPVFYQPLANVWDATCSIT